MSRKSLRHWAELYLSACQYASLASVDLSLTQFGAAHCMDPIEVEELAGYIEGVSL